MSAKRKCLNLEERVKVIKLLESRKSSRTVANEVSVGRTQIQNVFKRKREILDEFENNVNLDLKRPRRATDYDKINDLCYKWFLDASSRHYYVLGPLLKEKALKFASDLGVESFKASNGWLDSFLKKNNIVFRVQSGEHGEVDSDVVKNWKERIPSVCEGYLPSNIFNMEETGLFYPDTTKSTFFKKGETCSSGKRSKERITVALCVSVTGEKLPPLVIGKAQKPRCFQSLSTDRLPVHYYANKKVWMTASLMEDCLKWFDRKMKYQGRNILSFLDNAPSHPDVRLQNVKLQFLPANTTSVCQPMDQGIIQTLKLKYRKLQLQHVLAVMDVCATKTGSQILKEITVLKAIYWVASAWKEVKVETIQKCSAISGFYMNSDSVSNENVSADSAESEASASSNDFLTEEDNYPLAVHRMGHELFDCEFSELLLLDDKFETCDSDLSRWDKPATDLLQNDSVSHESEDDSISDDAEINVTEVNECLDKLKRFALQRGQNHLLDCVMKLDDFIVEYRVQDTVKQTKISDFLSDHWSSVHVYM